MDLQIVIAALRQRCPSFAAQGQQASVAGAAHFKQLEEATSIPLPYAFVIPLDDNAQPSKANNAIRQPLIDSFAVIVAIDNKVDEKGQTSTSSVRSIRADLWQALLGWRPTADYNGIEYQGGSMLKLDRARLWYQFEFGAYMEIGPSDSYQGSYVTGLPHLDTVVLNEDQISPQHDPNKAPAGQPDGRVEAQVTIPKTGALP